MNNTPNIQPDSQDQEINLKQLFEQYVFYWKWFVLSVIVCLIGAFLYLRYAERVYSISAKVLLQDEKQASGELAGLGELATSLTGGGTTPAFVSDQIDVIKSRRIMRKVVEDNRLNIQYYSKGNVKSSELLEGESPLKLVFLESNNPKQDSTVYIFTIKASGNSYNLVDDERTVKNIGLGKRIESPVGPIMLVPQGGKKLEGELLITALPVAKAVDDLLLGVQVTPNKEKQSYIVNFSLNHANRPKAELILNSLIDRYNQDVTDDRSRITKATSTFISSRLDLIAQDLASADKKVADYKDNNNLVDMGTEAQLYMQNASENEKKLLEYKTQLQLADMMKDATQGENSQLLPSNIGLQDISIQNAVKSYNELVLERDDLLKSATPDNPVVQNLTKNIQEINRSLQTSLQNYRQVLQSNVSSLEGQRNTLQGRLGQLPNQERGFKDISRQQQIVETLYLFLLQKREENEIKASATPANLKIIDSAYGSDIPVSPKKSIILLGALILGFLIPFGALYIKFLLDNKLHSRKDIEEKFNVPILGEIPQSDDPIIKDNDRSSLAEAFRILRTNISFMLGNRKDKSSVIFVTSTTSGEGKSFVTTNLSRILAMSGKSVLLIGADIRSPKVLDYLGLSHLQHTNIGITQFLVNPDMPIENIVIKKPGSYDFDVIYSGYVAPNPAELLMNGHFEDVIKWSRSHYDYVLVDTAPVSLVTDTLLISDSADLTVYVARANYLDKRLLNVPKELYEQEKLKNMAVVINDVDFARGYGYGYGYGYGDTGEVSLRKRLKNLIFGKDKNRI